MKWQEINKKAKTPEIYNKFARYFSLQHKPSSGDKQKRGGKDEEGWCCKPKYRANLLYISGVLAFLIISCHFRR